MTRDTQDMTEVTRYEPRVECMAYCYGGTARLEADEYLDESDPLAVVKLSDHLAALAQLRAYLLADDEGSYAAGYRQALADAHDAVGQVISGRGGYHPALAVAAIHALGTERQVRLSDGRDRGR